MPGIAAHIRSNGLTRCGGAALFLLLLSGPASALAQDARPNARITEADCRNRARTDEQIVVCGRRNAEDPYRIPKPFRKPAPGTRTGTALAVEVMGSGIPGAGTNIGAAGSAGSSKELYEQWLAEKNAAKKTAEPPR